MIIKNPCRDSTLLQLAIDEPVPDFYYYTAALNTDPETFTYVPFYAMALTGNVNYQASCTLALTSIIYDPNNTPVTVTDSSAPLSKPDANADTLQVFTQDITLLDQ